MVEKKESKKEESEEIVVEDKEDAPKEEKKKTEEKEEPEEKPEKKEEPKEEPEDEDEDDDGKSDLPFPTAPIVRLMKANLDDEKLIKKEVKIAMNKWLGKLCEKVSEEMNKFPYVTVHMNEFKEAKRPFEDLEGFAKEKERILSHFDAIKRDIERLERDLGKEEDEEEVQ